MSSATKELRAAVFARAKGLCESGCGHKLGDSGHLDHMFGRAKVLETVTNCWALCLRCDDSKTQNRPSAAHWLVRFGEHCKRYGFVAELEIARAKYITLKAKGLAP